jgi:hypothetical protein
LSRSPGIGFVLARSANGNGPLCWWRGQRCELSPTQMGPFASREDAALVMEGIENLMKMRSAGDLVIYGTDSPDGDVSFICEHGGHAGPGASELHTFIVRPANVTLPSPISHPAQLYDHFIRYQQLRKGPEDDLRARVEPDGWHRPGGLLASHDRQARNCPGLLYRF